MDRNREARRGTIMATPSNGLSSSRRRHRSSSLRDSPDEDGGVEVPEPGRLRDRGVVKKDRGDRDRDRERERSSRSKRRRENRMMIHHVNTGSNRDDGDDTSEESVNDEEEDEDDAGNGGGLRMLPPPPASQSTAAAAVTSNHHNHNPYSQQLHHRKSFPSSGNKVFRTSAAAPPPAWKAADEMIGVSVPRKARSASTKRSHEWSSGGVVGGGGGTELTNRQSSTSPVRLASSAASPAPVAPPSPSSSNVSVRKKMKANGGSKPRPPKSSSKSSSSNPEELEIEIAEVLYGLMTQSQAPSKKEIPPTDSTNKSSSEIKSKVSSPISNSTSLSTVAPKRKRPRQVSENPFSVRNSPVSSSIKTEIDHHQHHQSPKTDISSPYLENSSPASAVAAENGVSSFGFTTLPGHHPSSAPSSEPSAPEEEGKCGVGVVLTKEEVKESPAVGLIDVKSNSEAVITTAASTTTTNLKPANPESESKKEEKFEIDLMAPPPQQRTSHESDVDIDFSNHKQMLTQSSQHTNKIKEDEKIKSGKEELMLLTEDQKKSKAGTIHETGESSKQSINADLHIDFEKSNKDSNNRSLHQGLKHQQSSTKSETHSEKTAQPSSLPVPMSVANWPPMGYVAPLQGVISMDGSTMPSAPIQPLFSQPRPKRCATHCYIARNIHCLQQFMKINPFWPASGSAAPMFGTKHATELHANIPQSMQDNKGQPVGIFPGHTTAKDTKSSQTTAVPDSTHRKQQQQVLLQQGMPPVPPNNILHGPAFIFPFNQQQAVAASASVRPGSSKLSSSTPAGASGATNSATVTSSTTSAAAPPAMSFNYPNMNANETQYLAIVQNHPYAFPIPAVGASPNYRGNHPHPQAMPLFNGSFYSSQMIHPSQIPQPTQQQAPPPTQSQQTHQNSSGSTSSSQKHLQAQQRQQKSGAAANGGGMHNSYPAALMSNPNPNPKNRLTQQVPPARHLENEVTGGEDSPSTADSRGSRAAATNTMGVYGPNFSMPVHPQNFALMNNPQAGGNNNSSDKKLQQQQSQQQVLKRPGAESSSLPPQTFAMSFAPMNGTTGMSSMTQNHTFFQSLPDSSRQSYHHMMTPSAVPAGAPAHHSEQKKEFRISEEASRATGHDSSNVDDDRKGNAGLTPKSGQSIAFSRPDLATDTSGSSAPGASVIDSSSSRNINLGSNNNRSTRSQMSTSVSPAAQSSHHLHVQQQMLLKHQQQQHQQHQQQQQQQHANSRTKNQPPSTNGYPEHLITSSASSMMMFPNSLTSFPVQTSNMNSSPVQSPQWRNSVRGGPTSSQVSSSLSSTTSSSLKNLHQTQQQQSSRSHPQSHTQISFGAAASASPKLAAQMMIPQQQQQQQQQQQNHNASSNSGNQSPSSPMLVGSPTTSLSSSQQPKNTQRSSPSILGNPHNSNSTKSQQQQQQLQKQTLTQQQAQAKAYAQMMYSHPYMAQGQQHSVGSTQTGYYLPRKPLTQQVPPSSSTAMLSLCPPVTLTNTTTSDPAKAIAAATSNMKGGGQQGGILHAPQYAGGGGGGGGGSAVAAAVPSSVPAGFPQYGHNASAATVQVKPAEQKQPAGE